MSCCLVRRDGEAVGGVAEALDVRRLLPGGPVGAVAPLNLGISNVSSGAATYVAPSGTTSLLAHTERERWTIGAGAGSTAGHRNGVQIWSRGVFGGFRMTWVVHLQTLVNNAALGFRSIVCLRAATAVIPVANPSTLTDVVGFGFDPAAAPQWSLMHNDAAGACTVTPLGANFIANTTDLLAFIIAAERGGSQYECSAINLTVGAASRVDLTAAANIPASTLLLSENVWLNSNGDATTAATIDVAEIVAETQPLAV